MAWKKIRNEILENLANLFMFGDMFLRCHDIIYNELKLKIYFYK